MYYEHLASYKVALEKAKSLFYANIISNGQPNTMTLFSTVNKLWKPHDAVSLSPIQCVSYSNFFNSKIDSIHHELLNSVLMSSDNENGQSYLLVSKYFVKF